MPAPGKLPEETDCFRITGRLAQVLTMAPDNGVSGDQHLPRSKRLIP